VTCTVELKHRLTATYHQRSRAESNWFSAEHVILSLLSEQPDQYTALSIDIAWCLSGIMWGAEILSVHDCHTTQTTHQTSTIT